MTARVCCGELITKRGRTITRQQRGYYGRAGRQCGGKSKGRKAAKQAGMQGWNAGVQGVTTGGKAMRKEASERANKREG